MTMRKRVNTEKVNSARGEARREDGFTAEAKNGTKKRVKVQARPFTFIDLFAGCGGLSEGFYHQGFRALLHLEIDPTACETLKTRMRHYDYDDAEIINAVMCDDITRKGVVKEMDERIEEEVDVIIGGPPCQAFSSVGRAQDPNSMDNDPRNYLFENYVTVLNHFRPKFFVFENVKGILTAHPKGVRVFPVIIDRMRQYYDVINDPKVILLNAVNYGVPQNRERVIIIGARKDLGIDPNEVYKAIKKLGDFGGKKPFYTVRDAIADLPKISQGEGAERIDNAQTKQNAYLSLINSSLKPYRLVLNHTARKHNTKDQERYRILSSHEGWQLKELQTVRPDLIHHDPKHFGNRYTVQSYDKPGTTVVAHLFKDGNLFIHPDPRQARTFTVREAARIQSFPDDFFFEGSRTEQFRQVGNAVPPLFARAIASAIKTILAGTINGKKI